MQSKKESQKTLNVETVNGLDSNLNSKRCSRRQAPVLHLDFVNRNQTDSDCALKDRKPAEHPAVFFHIAANYNCAFTHTSKQSRN
jgi:hypothetical protein